MSRAPVGCQHEILDNIIGFNDLISVNVSCDTVFVNCHFDLGDLELDPALFKSFSAKYIFKFFGPFCHFSEILIFRIGLFVFQNGVNKSLKFLIIEPERRFNDGFFKVVIFYFTFFGNPHEAGERESFDIWI